MDRNVSSGLLNAALLVVVFWGLASAATFIVPLLVAGLLAFLMAPLVRIMRRARIPEALTITFSGLLLILPFFGLVFLLIRQGQSLIHDFPSLVASINRALADFSRSWIGSRILSYRTIDLSLLMHRLSESAERGVSIAIGGLAALVDATSKVALVLIFAIVMLASRESLFRSCERLLINAGHLQARAFLDEVVSLMERFLLARLLIMVIVGGVDLVVLHLFQVKYAILLSVLIGFMTMVPAIGFICAIVPTLLVALSSGFTFWRLLALFVLLFAVSLVESYVMTPTMVGRRLNINALGTFVGLYAGGVLWGVAGMLLSVPILGVLRIAFFASPKLSAWGELLSGEENPPLRGLTRAASEQRAGPRAVRKE